MTLLGRYIQYFLVVIQKKPVVPVVCVGMLIFEQNVTSFVQSLANTTLRRSVFGPCTDCDTWHLAEFWWNNSSPAPGTGISEQGAAAAGIWSIKCWQCRTQTCRHLAINRGCTAAAQFKTKLFFEETTKNDIIYIHKTRLRSLCYEESGECLVSVSEWHVHAQLISRGQLMTMIKNCPD